MTLLLRYPPLQNSSQPRTLVYDARSIQKSCTIDTGASLILKHTGRQPAPFDSSEARSASPLSSTPTRVRSPFASTSSPASLEALLQDAARGVLSRGERWGLNQAVRDVVGEVRRGVTRGIQSSTNSRPSSPRGGFHKARGSRGGSESHSAIAANVLRKMNALEERNRRLAEMLETAVKDLWACQEEMTEKAKQDATIAPENGKLMEKFSKSVAEVQFVQAFLRDMTLPLPEDVASDNKISEARDDKSETETSHSTSENVVKLPSTGSEAAMVPEADQKMPSDQVSSSSATKTAQTDSESGFSPVRSQASPKPPTSTAPIPIPTKNSITPLPSSLPTASAPPPLPPSPTPDPLLSRPRLAVSSFSWMLADNTAEDQPAFARATPFAPNERRHHARTGKGFLFGEEDPNAVLGDSNRKNSPARKGSRAKAASQQREDIDLENVLQEETEPSTAQK